ncbi:MAG: hypothetical protein KF790_06250 [Steroidobacteraceae bacterium]|nr:hypothetical protein [Steroidobacteraceae bacterium]
MEAKAQNLTAREQAYFEHVRQAKEQRLTLTGYCQKLGLNVRSLYSVRRDLVDKGVVSRTLAPRTRKTRPGKFVAVHIATPGTNGGEPVCWVRHPSGVTIECGRWPEAAWIAQLMKGGADAAA